VGKCYGEPYDSELRTSEHGSRIYNAWRNVRKHPHCDAWESYAVFYEWSTYNGYTPDAALRLIDRSKPYGPDNCEWYISDTMKIDYERAAEWDAVVNRIRKQLGMPPLEGTNYANH
jgi:hypothetical protein